MSVQAAIAARNRRANDKSLNGLPVEFPGRKPLTKREGEVLARLVTGDLAARDRPLAPGELDALLGGGVAEVLRQELDVNPSYAPAHRNLALVLGALGRSDEAAAHVPAAR